MFTNPASKKILQELHTWVGDVWKRPSEEEQRGTPYKKGIDIFHDPEHYYYAPLEESTRRLKEKFKELELGSGAAKLYFYPMTWIKIDPEHPFRSGSYEESCMFHVLETLVYLYPTNDLVHKLTDRISYILKHPVYGSEKVTEASIRISQQANNYYSPDLEDLQRLIRYLPHDEQLVDFANTILKGDLNIDVNVSYKPDEPRYKVAYRAAAYSLRQGIYMEYLYRHAELPYELFREALLQDKELVSGFSRLVWSRQKARETGEKKHVERIIYDEGFQELIDVYIERFTEELAAEIREDNYIYLTKLNHLRGSRWLLTAADVHKRFKLKKMVRYLAFRSNEDNWESPEALVIHLANAETIVPENSEDYHQLVESLKAYPRKTLEYMVPVTREARRLLLEALGWQSAAPLIDYILEIGMKNFGTTYAGKRDVANSPDPDSGAVNLKRYREARELAGQEVSAKILKLFYDAKVGVENTVRLLWAADGEGREKILKQLKRREQKSLKAYGLLPLERGDEEVLERYLYLQEFLKESKKFGPERSANEQGAVKTAIYHLAQVAGYPDVMRFEWDMEATLATEVVPIGKQWQIDDYEVTLDLKGSDPDLVIVRNDKRLKSVPQKVRQSDDYPVIRASVEEIREQARRFRSFFEGMMATAKVITKDDLELLNRMPVPTFMLEQLILKTADGDLGLYRSDNVSIEMLNGERQSINKEVIIAHPVHLQDAAQLAEWQQYLINQRIVQPFKQAYREFYVLTPAELETQTYSNRFAGSVVDGGKAVRLFQARDWDMEDRGDIKMPQKRFPEAGLSAHFTFTDVMNYWSSDFPVTSDQIRFRIYPFNRSEYRDHIEDAYLPLDQVPKTIFSEVMRDADLVVSVGEVEESELASWESVKPRIDLVQALLSELGLKGVTFDENDAIVEGKLANYRVNMGSARIFIEPGSYLCVVPDRWGKEHDDIFLPFSDEGNDKVSEVISKILLLLNDDKIKDKSIRSQIERKT